MKFRLRTTLNAFTVDNVGGFESLIPGWQVTDRAAVTVGSDANGTYVSAQATNGTAFEILGRQIYAGFSVAL